jgi:hypothetical protein
MENMSDEKKNEPLFPPLMEKEGYPYRFDPRNKRFPVFI